VNATSVTTTVATGTNWHVQAWQGQLQLENGVEYVIRFKMNGLVFRNIVWGYQSGRLALDWAQ
jgi:hypothetical protein